MSGMAQAGHQPASSWHRRAPQCSRSPWGADGATAEYDCTVALSLRRRSVHVILGGAARAAGVIVGRNLIFLAKDAMFGGAQVGSRRAHEPSGGSGLAVGTDLRASAAKGLRAWLRRDK